MANIQLFVEDELSEAYEHLTSNALGIKQLRRRSKGKQIRASKLDVNEYIDVNSLLDLTYRAARTGASQVFFILDEEDPQRSPERATIQRQFKQAFEALCREIERLPKSKIRVVRVVCKTCLECWLLADPAAVVSAAGAPKSYSPKSSTTTTYGPRQARDQIAHIFNEVNRRQRNKKRRGGRSVKSEGAKIAGYVDLDRASKNNYSLAYFCDMLINKRDGCKHSFPEHS
ncbi:hypothetical protein KFU94_64565 [Chloroflexi bacterium TSY]|nr:hypothetical protein [Chloroflexi bacterium TSY]MBV7339025.1 hypothetical protein [Chloroflexi bacterium TSY]